MQENPPILRTSLCRYGMEALAHAEKLVREGQPVAIPTETVYGLGANALDAAAVAGIFRAWLEPFKDLEAGTLTLENTGGTDHLSFDAVGIPGFQFIQDPMAYFSRTHHSNMDNLDHLVEADLQQAATIIASFIMHTAMRDEMMPRKSIDVGKKEEATEGRSKP